MARGFSNVAGQFQPVTIRFDPGLLDSMQKNHYADMIIQFAVINPGPTSQRPGTDAHRVAPPERCWRKFHHAIAAQPCPEILNDGVRHRPRGSFGTDDP